MGDCLDSWRKWQEYCTKVQKVISSFPACNELDSFMLAYDDKRHLKSKGVF